MIEEMMKLDEQNKKFVEHKLDEAKKQSNTAIRIAFISVFIIAGVTAGYFCLLIDEYRASKAIMEKAGRSLHKFNDWDLIRPILGLAISFPLIIMTGFTLYIDFDEGLSNDSLIAHGTKKYTFLSLLLFVIIIVELVADYSEFGKLESSIDGAERMIARMKPEWKDLFGRFVSDTKSLISYRVVLIPIMISSLWLFLWLNASSKNIKLTKKINDVWINMNTPAPKMKFDDIF